MPAPARRYKRTDLFLVRIWTEDGPPEGAAESAGGEKTGTPWRGRVQRVVDGESHQFYDWHGLIDLLVAMVAAGGASHEGHGAGQDREEPGAAEGER